MPARVVTLRFDPVLEAFDDGPLQGLLRAKDVLTIRDHFFIRNEVPYLAVVVTNSLPPPLAEPAVSGKGRGRDSSWRAQVSEEDLPLFNALRDWRAERARRDGVPPYVICTNKQLAAMVNARPGSLSGLGAIEGIGKAKLDNYGQELLAFSGLPRVSGSGAAGRQEAGAPAPPRAKAGRGLHAGSHRRGGTGALGAGHRGPRLPCRVPAGAQAGVCDFFILLANHPVAGPCHRHVGLVAPLVEVDRFP